MNMYRQRHVRYLVPTSGRAEKPVIVQGAKDFTFPDGWVVRRMVDGSLMIVRHPDGSAGGQVLTSADPSTLEAWRDMTREIELLETKEKPAPEVPDSGGGSVVATEILKSIGSAEPVWKRMLPLSSNDAEVAMPFWQRVPWKRVAQGSLVLALLGVVVKAVAKKPRRKA